MNLIPFKHPAYEETVCIAAEDMDSDRILIGLYDEDGTKRSRAEAWMGNGKPSDIRRVDALNAIRAQYADSNRLLELKVRGTEAGA